MPKSENGDNSAKCLQNFTKSYSGHLHLGHSLYAKYHDPTSNSYPDILLTRFNRFTMHKLENGDNSAKYPEFYEKLIRSSTPWIQPVCQIP